MPEDQEGRRVLAQSEDLDGPVKLVQDMRGGVEQGEPREVQGRLQRQAPPAVAGTSCEVCGATFESSHPLARYCPPTPEDRERQKGFARSRCARRALNARQRGQALTAPLPQPFNCAHCGRRCVPGEDGIDYRASRFCCRQHKAVWHRETSRSEESA